MVPVQLQREAISCQQKLYLSTVELFNRPKVLFWIRGLFLILKIEEQQACQVKMNVNLRKCWLVIY
jgi:hypothetical protein